MSALAVIAYCVCPNEKRKNFNLIIITGLFYPLLIFAMIISLVYLLRGEVLIYLGSQSIWYLILLHLPAVFIIALFWAMSKRISNNNNNNNNNNIQTSQYTEICDP
jgi:magnesium-transporting ATPase (P-type)